MAAALSRARTCVVATHRNADPDALASAVLALRACEALGARACLLLPEGASRQARRAAEAAGLDLDGLECRDPVGADALVVVDASNSAQLGPAWALAAAAGVVLVDHHEPGDVARVAVAMHLEPGAASAAQLALEVAMEAGYTPGPREATLALAGILYDTRRFSAADPGALRAAARLLEAGGDYHAALQAIQQHRETGMEYSERLARLKAAQRVIITRFCKEYIVAVSRVGSFESSAARGLLELGADVAVVAAPRESEIRVSIRVSRRALEAGVHASELARFIAEKHGGSGGGHRSAGMAHIPHPGDLDGLVGSLSSSITGKAARLCTQARGGAGPLGGPGQGGG